MKEAGPASTASDRLARNRRVDAVCSRFEADWRATDARGTRPRLDDYLAEIPEPERSFLLGELISLDAAYRRLAGEDPKPHDYQARFAGLDASWLEQAISPEGPQPSQGPTGQPMEDLDTIRAIGLGRAGHGQGEVAARGASGTRYRILRRHAKGGLGEVFVAEDQELHREVALKEIQAQHAHVPVCQTRFLLEAEITGRLEHPGIVPVYGFGCHSDGRPFYAMRLIHGESMEQAIARFHTDDQPGRDPGERILTFRQLLRRFLDACNAVAYAHSRGVLHRDLKPANIMLGKYGETLVVDWGLAKTVGHNDAAPMRYASGCRHLSARLFRYQLACQIPGSKSGQEGAGGPDDV